VGKERDSVIAAASIVAIQGLVISTFLPWVMAQCTDIFPSLSMLASVADGNMGGNARLNALARS
jgi:hypothetical protein